MSELTKSKQSLSRRAFLRLAGATAASGALAACAPLDQPPPAGVQPAATPVPEAGQVAGPTPATSPAAAGQVDLRFRTFLDPQGTTPREEALAWVLDEFQNRNPNITITTEVTPFDQLDARLIVENEAGTAPDISYLSPQLIAKHAAAGSLLPLNPFIDAMGADWRNQFYSEGLWEQTVIDGNKLTIAIGAHTRILFTRKDFLQEAGLPEDTVPQTLDELVEVAQELTQGQTFGLGYSLGPTRSTHEIYWNAVLWGMGGSNLDEEGRATFNSEIGVETMEWLRALIRTHRVTPEEVLSLNYTEFSQAFPEGRYGMILDGNYRLSGWLAMGMNEDNMGAGLFPSTEAGRPAPVFTNSWDLGMPSSTPPERRDAAWQFISFFFEPDANLRYVAAEGSLPPIEGLLEDEAFQTPWHRVLGEALSTVGRPLERTAFAAELADTISNAIQAAILNNRDSQEVLDEAAAAFNQLAGVS